MELKISKTKNLYFALSAALIVAGLIAMVISWITLGAPLRLGLDFTGGTLVQLRFSPKAPAIEAVRPVVEKQLGITNIQQIGDQNIAIRTRSLSTDERTKLQEQLRASLGKFEIERIETVGPTIGQELLTNGLLALGLSLVGILAYLAFRFQFDYAICASIALFHDVLVLLGIFSILGLLFGVEVDTLFVVALLTVVGFSVQDTVVVYDRIRENLKFQSRKKTFPDIVDDSVNQTLVRSINTTVTAQLVLLPLAIFGGETIRLFALALIVGFLSGTYSSIFNASALLIWWRERKTTAPVTAKAQK
ncbi:protein translocase subunit SecF [Gloeobacter kilaueensis]|uniref:Protein-export membrane protein SecF n=1 Tax=Gloeobacter kilaueensis (strain ATCC BAA-2537 / CCAP 1431/1 / ULC 316 / JS1) TaxID=1183438 RepID=U5QP28_GLOK1|nr:protein translocase subunit SecF [Gloeobacter kilaueensis]AGY60701.1 preprotein translocase subunit SecF [Gloeobacter kilaueensis JS1]